MNSNAHGLNFDRSKRGRKTARLNKFIAETRNKKLQKREKVDDAHGLWINREMDKLWKFFTRYKYFPQNVKHRSRDKILF